MTAFGEGGGRASARLRCLLWAVAVANLAYFAVESTIAVRIGSVSLLADAMDFLEDATINFLVLWALKRTRRLQTLLAFGLAAIMAAPGLGALWVAHDKLVAPQVPSAVALTLTGAGGFAVNFACAALLKSLQAHGNSLVRAAFLSARNDVIGNLAIIIAGFVTLFVHSAWPDVVVGLGLFALYSGAAFEVFQAARKEVPVAGTRNPATSAGQK